MMPLGLLSPGEQGEIVAIRVKQTQDCCECCMGGKKAGCRVEDIGLRVGKNVEMLNNAQGPILVKIDESRIALDRGMAMKIMVRR